MSKCTSCAGTGEIGRMGFLDCIAPGCTAVIERMSLNAHIKALGPMTKEDRDWACYQFAIEQERATAAANLMRIAELYAVGDSSARIELSREIARVTL